MKKDPKISALLSLLFPGLGHLYLKKLDDAVVLIIATGFLWGVYLFKGWKFTYMPAPRRLIFWGGLVIVYFYSIVDAYSKAKKS